MGTELSIAPAAWTCDSREMLSETRTSTLDYSSNHMCIPLCGCGSRRESLPQHAQGAMFFCRSPRMAASVESKSGERRFAAEGIGLIINLTEF